AAAPVLRVLTWPLLAVSIVTLGRGWYLRTSHGGHGRWERRAGWTLAASTVLTVVLWALRFAGLLGGPSPI
ncbi:MAG: hypothetical protein IIC82_00675, partial [Chloroflexi bacterium]|nr:hypothetical protein [Chloroflexota bacterium]